MPENLSIEPKDIVFRNEASALMHVGEVDLLVPNAEMIQEAQKTLDDYLLSNDIDPYSVVFAGYDPKGDKKKGDEDFQVGDKSVYFFCDYEGLQLPLEGDSEDVSGEKLSGNALLYALKNGTLGIYDRGTLKSMLSDGDATDYDDENLRDELNIDEMGTLALICGKESVEKAKIGELSFLHEKEKMEDEFAQNVVLLGIDAAIKHIKSAGSAEEAPKYLHFEVEGGHDDLKEIAASEKLTNAYIDSNLELFESFIASGETQKAEDLLQSVLSHIRTHDPTDTGALTDFILENKLSNERSYSLYSAISRVSKQAQGTLLGYMTGKNYGSMARLSVDGGSEDIRVLQLESAIEMSIDDDRQEGRSLRRMFIDLLTNGINGVEKTDELVKKQAEYIKRIFQKSGLSVDQATKVFNAASQSRDKSLFGGQSKERIIGSFSLLEELQDKLSNVEAYSNGINKIVNVYGIRNLHRYKAEDLLPQLKEDFVPEEVVMTAVHDPGGALSNPVNSSNGLEYKKPAYFEIAESMDIPKVLLRIRRSGGKPVDRILIRAHGNANGFALSGDREVRSDDLANLDASGWDKSLVEKGIVDPKAEVVFESCSLGAGEFPQRLYKRTGIESLTASANITGAAMEGSPGVRRDIDGKIKFGTEPINMGEVRDPNTMTDPVLIKK